MRDWGTKKNPTKNKKKIIKPDHFSLALMFTLLFYPEARILWFIFEQFRNPTSRNRAYLFPFFFILFSPSLNFSLYFPPPPPEKGLLLLSIHVLKESRRKKYADPTTICNGFQDERGII